MESSSPLEATQRNTEEDVPSESRVQKSLVYNRHLPYYSRLPNEASLLLEEIKVNLSAAVQKWELWPGALYWTNRLGRCVLWLWSPWIWRGGRPETIYRQAEELSCVPCQYWLTPLLLDHTLQDHVILLARNFDIVSSPDPTPSQGKTVWWAKSNFLD